jgi:Ser/Thr protein kinase RdoA (MazF antagonist)
MTHLAACGYPVPRVYEITDTDMVLERLAGPTMLDVLARRPWRVGSLGRELGRLHDRLHALPAPEWLPKRFSTADGDRVLHLDLHPTFTRDDRVRHVIHNFNADGFASLYLKYKGGRPTSFTLPERREIKKIAKS